MRDHGYIRAEDSSGRFSRRGGSLKVVLLVTALVLVLALLVFLLIRLASTDTDFPDFDGRDPSIVMLNGEKYRMRTGVETYLLLGLDKFGNTESSNSYNNQEQSDFILLLVADRASRTWSLLHLNRDTMTEVDILGIGGQVASRDEMQLALAHTYGDGGKESCLNAKRAVSRLLYGAGIDHYISLKMDAVMAINDYIGGVTVTVEEDLSEIDPTLVPGEVTLHGELALKYVRVRYGLEDSSNLSRMNRQKTYLAALLTELAEQEVDEKFIEGAYSAIESYAVLDSTSAMENLLEVLSEYEYQGIRSPEGTEQMGEEFIEYYVDKESLEALVAQLFCEPYKK